MLKNNMVDPRCLGAKDWGPGGQGGHGAGAAYTALHLVLLLLTIFIAHHLNQQEGVPIII